MDIIDQCASAILTIDTSILTDTNLNYVIGSVEHTEQLATVKVSSDVDLALYSCPIIEFSFENQITGDPLDTDVFTYDDSTLQFKIENSDVSKGGNIYAIRMRANL